MMATRVRRHTREEYRCRRCGAFSPVLFRIGGVRLCPDCFRNPKPQIEPRQRETPEQFR